MPSQEIGGKQEEDGGPQSPQDCSISSKLLNSQAVPCKSQTRLSSLPLSLCITSLTPLEGLNSAISLNAQMKSVKKPRTLEKEVVVVRRSSRVANLPAPVYKEVSQFSSLALLL